MKTKRRLMGLLFVALLTGCGSAHRSGSTAPNNYTALEKADRELGIAARYAAPAQTRLTAQNFDVLTRTTRGFTSAEQAKTATRVRQGQRADAMTATTARAALREANSATKALAPIALGTQPGSGFPPGAFASALFNISSDEATYWRTLAAEADVSEHIAPMFTAEAVAEGAWLRQYKKGAFASKKAAKAALDRAVYKALAPSMRLRRSAGVLGLRARQASHSLSSDLAVLRLELRDDRHVRQTAERVRVDDPSGFLARRFKQSN